MKNRKKLLMLPFPCLALLLELLPTGAVLVFASPDESIRRTFSYFSLTPFGYANFPPFLTAVGTCVLCVLAIVCLIRDSAKLHRLFRYLALSCAIVSLGSLVFGTAYFTLTGAGITLCLLGSFLIPTLVLHR